MLNLDDSTPQYYNILYDEFTVRIHEVKTDKYNKYDESATISYTMQMCMLLWNVIFGNTQKFIINFV